MRDERQMAGDDAREWIEAWAPDFVRDYVERQREALAHAVGEIDRLHEVIAGHMKLASGHVVSNIAVDVITVPDMDGMRTRISTRPHLYEFYLAEKLAGCSDEHKRAFHKNVVREFSEREAEKIALSIWGKSSASR